MNRSFNTQDEISSLLSFAKDERLEFSDRSLRGLMLIKRKNGGVKWFLKYLCPRTHQKRSHLLGAFPEMSLHSARQKGMEVIRTEFGSDLIELAFLPIDKSDLSALDLQPNQEAARGSSRLSAQDVQLEQLMMSQKAGMAPIPFGEIRPFITICQFVIDHYLPYIKVAKRSWATDVSMLNNHILPMLGGYVMIDMKPFVVQEMVQSLSRKGLSASTCNRALIILRFMYNCALKWEILPKIENPCKNVKELALNNKKERFLNGNEVNVLKIELQKSKNKFLPYIVQLLLLTGCRRGEALKAKIQHFDLGRGDWIVPLAKAGKARHIPLNDMAIQTIRAALEMKSEFNQVTRESPYLFPNPTTGDPFQQIFYSWDKARKSANIDAVRMHDLRHSFASALVNSGMTLYDVKEILGHTNIKTTERYAHLSNSRLRQAAESVTTFYQNQDWIGQIEGPMREIDYGRKRYRQS